MAETKGVKTLQKYTPTQQRMLTLFSDGLSHTPDEIRQCLHDPDGSLSKETKNGDVNNIIRLHVSMLRAKLRKIGHDIVCELGNRRDRAKPETRCPTYRQMRLLNNEE